MKQNSNNVAELLSAHVPRASDREVETAGERVLYRLHHLERSVPQEEMSGLVVIPPRLGRWWFAATAAAAAGILAAVFWGVVWETHPGSRGKAVVESVNEVRPLTVGDSVRSGSATGTLLVLPDGSQVEMRAESQLSLEAASDGLRIQLSQGSVIVNAVKQKTGVLQVQTPDLTASVVGTVFLVSVTEESSLVGVIEGEVRVRRGESETSLSAGQQTSSLGLAKEAFVPESVAWSRSAAAYLALLTQSPPASAPLSTQRPTFEVASIRRNVSGMANGGIAIRGDRLVGTNTTLRALLIYAFQPMDGKFGRQQIVGGPGWMETDRFDIDAKVEGDGRSIPIDQIRKMVQALLEDRFQLKARQELRELPVFDLVLSKSGPKLSADQTPPDRAQSFINFISEGEPLAPLPRGAVRMIDSPVRTALTGTAISVPTLVTLLQGRSDRLIVDKTAFTGFFDLDIQFAKDSGALVPDNSIPSLFAAIEDFGMKLQQGTARLPVIIVESAQRPSEN